MDAFGFSKHVPQIIALQGASRETIQSVLAEFAARCQRRGFRVGGMVEIAGACGRGACGSLALKDLSSGATFSISQDLGPGSIACNLDTDGLSAACAAVERAIASGVDIVVLSKFGKQEAARSGFCDAFRAAISAGLPVVTAVSPNLAKPWLDFAGPLSEFVTADIGALEAWVLASAGAALSIAAE